MFVIFAVYLFAGRYFLSPFHQFVHVLGNLVICDFCIDLGTGDICMSHHLGDALYRNASGNQQGSEGVPGLVMGEIFFKLQCVTDGMHLMPKYITDGQRENGGGYHRSCCKATIYALPRDATEQMLPRWSYLFFYGYISCRPQPPRYGVDRACVYLMVAVKEYRS